ncbi:replicase [Bat circovirus]|uniref:Replication-associated protein n=1 Tax=Bat circovirus TaxID=1329650 RepID=A0A6G8IYX4_9CIRC|nr:replicase [Bat circovirus]QIM58708.1 replicase [Bat circovirus]
MSETEGPAGVKSARRSREAPAARWCFTLNNPTDEEKAQIAGIADEKVKYLIVGEEVGDSGTPHLQGFINLRAKVRLQGLKQLLGPRAHCEKARGTDEDNKKYCGKDGKLLVEKGEPHCKGKRTDLANAVRILLEEKSLAAVAAALPEVYVRNHRGLAQLLLDHPAMQMKRAWKSDVTVWVGPPGVGKSRACLDMCPDAYWKPRGKWWDGYNGHKVVILDDFYGWLPFDDLLRLLDRYPLTVETKGGTRAFLAEKILITSNKLPNEWYSDEFSNKDALYRRINKILWWDGKEFVPPPHFVFPNKIDY